MKSKTDLFLPRPTPQSPGLQATFDAKDRVLKKKRTATLFSGLVPQFPYQKKVLCLVLFSREANHKKRGSRLTTEGLSWTPELQVFGRSKES